MSNSSQLAAVSARGYSSPSRQPCFRQIEVTLNSAQRVIIDHPLVAQADDGFAFDASPDALLYDKRIDVCLSHLRI